MIPVDPESGTPSLYRMNTNNKWNVGLWGLQVLLAALFLRAGSSKIMTPIPDLATQMS